MKRRIKKFFRNNQWVFIAIVDIAILLLFMWMIADYVLEIAEFYAYMKIYAG